MPAPPRCARFPVGHGRLRHRLPLALPWFFRGGRTLQRRLMAAEQERHGRPDTLGALVWIVAWTGFGVGEIVRALWREGRVASIDPEAMPLWRQALALTIACYADNLTPLYFYRFRLYRPSRWRQRGRYVYGWQCGSLLLKPAGRRLAFGNNKFAFWRACRRHGLPTVPVIAAYRGPRWLAGEAGADGPWPPIDLVLKASSAEAGKRVEVWIRRPDADGWTNGRTTATEGDLRARLQLPDRCEHVWLVQPCMNNDAALHLPPDLGLANARIATVRFPDGRIELLAASHRLPRRGPGLVINMVRGHFIAPIELATGRLGPAESSDLWQGRVARHPDTGRTFADEVLPRWDEAVALVRRAHAVFDAFPFVGWDVIFNPDGVRLLELNPGSSGFLLQLDGQPPLADTVVDEWHAAWRNAPAPAPGQSAHG